MGVGLAGLCSYVTTFIVSPMTDGLKHVNADPIK